MILCLSCKKLNSRGSQFCVSCGRSLLGTAVCKNGHRVMGNGALFCSICRTKQIVPAAEVVNLGWVSRLIAWVLTYVILRFLFNHLGYIGAAVDWVFGRFFGVGFERLVILAISVTFVYVCIAGVVGLFSANSAKKMNPLPKILPFAFKVLGLCVIWLARLVLRLVEGRGATASPTPIDKGSLE